MWCRAGFGRPQRAATVSWEGGHGGVRTARCAARGCLHVCAMAVCGGGSRVRRHSCLQSWWPRGWGCAMGGICGSVAGEQWWLHVARRRGSGDGTVVGSRSILVKICVCVWGAAGVQVVTCSLSCGRGTRCPLQGCRDATYEDALHRIVCVGPHAISISVVHHHKHNGMLAQLTHKHIRHTMPPTTQARPMFVIVVVCHRVGQVPGSQ